MKNSFSQHKIFFTFLAKFLLFFIAFFFNNQLKYDTTNDFEFANDAQKLNYKWDTRFNRFFENEIVTQTKDWHIDWTKEQQNFKNFYLLRDFKYSTDSFDGFEEVGCEVKIKEEKIPFLQQLKESFLNFKFVQNHFESPIDSWDVATNLNSDGSELIIENLTQVSNNLTKTNHYSVAKIDIFFKAIANIFNLSKAIN